MPFPAKCHAPGVIRAPSWTPAQFPSLTGWWSMKRSPGLPAVGADITSWQDMSGAARHLLQRTVPSAQPMPSHVIRNTYPAMEFNGTNELFGAGPAQSGNLPLSTMVGATGATNTGLQAVVFELNGNPSGTAAAALYYNNNLLFGDEGQYFTVTAATVSGSPGVYAAIWDGAAKARFIACTTGTRHAVIMRHTSSGGSPASQLQSWLDGVAQTDLASGGPQSGVNPWEVGHDSSASGKPFFSGWVYEALTSTANGSAGDITNLITYLKAEWGIP